MKDQASDIDPVESQEWQDAIADVIERDGANRAHFLLDKAVQQARAAGANLPFSATTPYQNTIPVDDQHEFPGDLEMELLETSALEDLAGISRVIEACDELGVRFALGDLTQVIMYVVFVDNLASEQGFGDIFETE